MEHAPQRVLAEQDPTGQDTRCDRLLNSPQPGVRQDAAEPRPELLFVVPEQQALLPHPSFHHTRVVAAFRAKKLPSGLVVVPRIRGARLHSIANSA